jgi:hypothetical protein
MHVTDEACVTVFKTGKASNKWRADELFSIAIIFILNIPQRPLPPRPGWIGRLEQPVTCTISDFRVAIGRKLGQAHAHSVPPISTIRLSQQDQLGAQ